MILVATTYQPAGIEKNILTVYYACRHAGIDLIKGDALGKIHDP